MLELNSSIDLARQLKLFFICLLKRSSYLPRTYRIYDLKAWIQVQGIDPEKPILSLFRYIYLSTDSFKILWDLCFC